MAERRARPPHHRRALRAGRRRRRTGRHAVPPRARRRRRAVEDDRQAVGADRRRPLRRNRDQHVRPRGRLLLRAVGTHDDRSSGVLLRRPRPRDAGLGAADRGRIAARQDLRPARRGRRRRRDARAAHARASPCGLLGRPEPHRAPVPPPPRRRAVPGCGRLRLRHRVADHPGVPRRPDHAARQGVRRRVLGADPRAVRQAVRRTARALARRLAARQPLPHRRRRGHCDRLAADRPFGRAARPLVLRDAERERRRPGRLREAVRHVPRRAALPRRRCRPRLGVGDVPLRRGVRVRVPGGRVGRARRSRIRVTSS